MATKSGSQAGPIRLGIAPIGWSNDDLPELGGDIPLETCLARRARPASPGSRRAASSRCDPEALQPVLEQHGPGAGHRAGSPGGSARRPSRRRRTASAAAARPLPRDGAARSSSTPRLTAPCRARSTRPSTTGRTAAREIKRYGEKLTGSPSLAQGRGLPDDLPSPHGHGDRGRERDRPADGSHRPRGRPPARHRAPHLRGRRRRRHHAPLGPADQPCPLQEHPADVLERLKAERWSFLKGVLEGVFTVPGDPEGCIDFCAFAKVLKEIGYAGWVVVEAEQDPKKANPLEMADRLSRADRRLRRCRLRDLGLIATGLVPGSRSS